MARGLQLQLPLVAMVHFFLLAPDEATWHTSLCPLFQAALAHSFEQYRALRQREHFLNFLPASVFLQPGPSKWPGRWKWLLSTVPSNSNSSTAPGAELK